MVSSFYLRGSMLQGADRLGGTHEPVGCGVVVIASSAGGITALKELLSGLPAFFPAPIVVVQHLAPSSRGASVMDQVLFRASNLPVRWAVHRESMRPGTVYLAPQDHHTTIEKGGRIRLSRGEKVNFVRPSADPLFISSAQVFGHRAVGVVLSGSCSDGAEGAAELIAAGSRVYVQSKESCSHVSMPLAAGRRCNLSASFTPAELVVLLMSIATSGKPPLPFHSSLSSRSAGLGAIQDTRYKTDKLPVELERAETR